MTAAAVTSTHRVSFSEYARRRGVTAPAVHKAIKAGRLKEGVWTDPATGRRWIDVDVADREWTARTDQAQQRDADAIRQGKLFAEGQRADAFEQGQPEPPPKSSAGGAASEGYQLARATREATQARLLQIELELAQGRYVSRADVEREAQIAARTLQTAILNVPARVEAECAALTDPRKVHDLLMRELRLALSAVADALEQNGPAKPGS